MPSPFGEITFRTIDHQSTLGAYVGKTALKDGKGVMVDSVYRKGSDYLPSDAEVDKLRPKDELLSSPSPRSSRGEGRVRGCFHALRLAETPLTRLASGDASRPLPASGAR